MLKGKLKPILIFGLIGSGIWAWLEKRKKEKITPTGSNDGYLPHPVFDADDLPTNWDDFNFGLNYGSAF